MCLFFRATIASFLLLASAACHKEQITEPQRIGWAVQQAPLALTGFDKVCFATSQTGWILGGYYVPATGASSRQILLRTDNGGATWTSIELASLKLGNGFSDIYPINDQVIYAIASDQTAAAGAQYLFVYKSTDSGRTWIKLLSRGFAGGRLLFLTEQVGFAANADAIVKTTDGGTTWHTVWNDGLAGFSLLQYPTATVGYAAGGLLFDQTNSGILVKTTDAGETWQNMHWNHGAITQVKFLSEAVGFVTSTETRGWTGYSYKERTTALYKTTDGGLSWQLLHDLAPNGHYTILGDQDFYCAGDSIQHTQDGGAIWKTEYTISNNSMHDRFTDLQFPISSIGYAVSQQGLIIKNIIP